MAAVERLVTGELGWLFREQPISDFGIDALIEIVEGERATGRLIAAQVKSGASYFREAAGEGIIFRGDSFHLEYWLNHSLPVIVVLFDAESEQCLWAEVSKSAATVVGQRWQMVIPRSQVLTRKTAAALAVLAEGPPYLLRLRQLQMLKPFMERLEKGSRLLLDVVEWVNKSSGRGDFSLVVETESGSEETIAEWPFVILPGVPYEEIIPQLFPWAEISLDDETYDQHDHERWDLECGVWDSEDGCYIMHTQTFEEWSQARISKGDLRPYDDDGEVAHWRLELNLNDLGRAFLLLDDHLGG